MSNVVSEPCQFSLHSLCVALTEHQANELAVLLGGSLSMDTDVALQQIKTKTLLTGAWNSSKAAADKMELYCNEYLQKRRDMQLAEDHKILLNVAAFKNYKQPLASYLQRAIDKISTVVHNILVKKCPVYQFWHRCSACWHCTVPSISASIGTSIGIALLALSLLMALFSLHL